MDLIVGIILIFLAVFLIAIVVMNVKIVPQSKAYVIERLGAYSATWQTGIHVKIPFIERIAKQVSLKEQIVDFPPQPVITKDNVTMQIDTVVFFQITDPKPATSSTPRSEACSTKRPTRGASRSTELSLKTSCRPERFRTRWRNR